MPGLVADQVMSYPSNLYSVFSTLLYFTCSEVHLLPLKSVSQWLNAPCTAPLPNPILPAFKVIIPWLCSAV